MSDWGRLLAVILGTIVAAIVGIGLAQNTRCKRCGIRRADCDCPGGPS